MKIAVVSSTFPPYAGGIGNVAASTARALVDAGHSVTVFTPRYRAVVEEVTDLRIERIAPLFSIGNSAFIPGLVKRLRGFDIIHLHYPFFGGAEPIFFARGRLRKTGTRIILHYHMDVVGDGARRGFFTLHKKILLPWMINLADAVIVTSLDYAMHSNITSSVRKAPKHFFEIPNGVDAQVFFPAKKSPALLTKHQLSAIDRVVLFVGGLDRAHYFKGVEYLIEAMNRLRTAPYIWKMLIVGEGELKNKYADIVAQLNLEHRVIFTGYVTNELLPDYYRLADVVVLPSVDKSEAFGLTLLEAMACGKPVVASNLPGVRSVVDEGVNGLLAEPKNAGDLAAKINYLLVNPDVAAQYGAAGRKKVEVRYGWKIISGQLDALYRSLNHGG